MSLPRGQKLRELEFEAPSEAMLKLGSHNGLIDIQQRINQKLFAARRGAVVLIKKGTYKVGQTPSKVPNDSHIAA